jgi:hypothetical protein
MFSFDHDLNRFVGIGTGTVTEDGLAVVSDPGFGIEHAGWGGSTARPPTTCAASCDDGDNCTEDFCEDGECTHEPVETCDECEIEELSAPPPGIPHPYPDDDTANMTTEARTALGCLRGAIAESGGGHNLTSAFRPQAYQEHLQEVWDKAAQCRENDNVECSERCDEILNEFEDVHRLDSDPGLRPVTRSTHTEGTGFDLPFTVPAGTDIDQLARDCSLVRPDPTGDPRHFNLPRNN